MITNTENIIEELEKYRGQKLAYEQMLASPGWGIFTEVLQAAEQAAFAEAKRLTRDVMRADDAMAVAQMLQQGRLYERVRMLAEVQLESLERTITELKNQLEAHDGPEE